MKILALDTSTAACSVALWIEGEGRERFEISGSRHSELLLPMVEKIMQEAGLSLHQCDAVAVGEGPGSFTGLRIGIGVAQGLAFGAGVPIIQVSSLLAQANRHPAPHSLCAFDARMGQLYWGLYRTGLSGLAESITDVALSAPGEVRLDPSSEWLALGPGCDRYQAELKSHHPDVHIDFVTQSLPHALDIARIAVEYYSLEKTIPAEAATPRYVRNKVTS